jgi:hypothetical protein
MTNTELSDSKEMGSAYPSQVRTLAACNARLKDEETKVGEEDSAAVRTRVEGGGVKMHEMQDHLCRVSRSRNQGTPHGVEGDPHTGPKPLMPCFAALAPYSTTHNGCCRAHPSKPT